MKTNQLVVPALMLLISSCTPKANWEKLFNEKDLSNFEVLNGTAEYRIEANCIIGVSKMDTPNTFLATKQLYSDFILEFEVWADSSVNSGVQFRSISDPNIKKGRVHGYQVEIESSSRKWAGGIYDEARRGWLYPLKENIKGQNAFNVNEWNKYRIEAIGNEIKTWVNGVQCTNLIDDVTAKGLIGLQVHSIGEERQAGKEIKWRNLRIMTTNLDKNRKPSSPYAQIIDTRTNGL